uniref:Myristoylated alanine-rich C-kinase substrate n=1 Tax=Eptatretus burgeri TaxID=7764 RepID=A0A8C4X2F4_EPTBU
MGAQFSKTAEREAALEKPGEAAVVASPPKTNEQDGEHVRVNGDAPSPGEAKGDLQANGSAPVPAEDEAAAAPKEDGKAGDVNGVEAASVEAAGKAAQAEEAVGKTPKADEGAASETPAVPAQSGETPKKKKKRFSFKKSFKLSGFSFKKKRDVQTSADAEATKNEVTGAEGDQDKVVEEKKEEAVAEGDAIKDKKEENEEVVVIEAKDADEKCEAKEESHTTTAEEQDRVDEKASEDKKEEVAPVQASDDAAAAAVAAESTPVETVPAQESAEKKSEPESDPALTNEQNSE